MEIAGIEFTGFQLFLIGALLFVTIFGFFNMLRVKKRKKEMENFDYSDYNDDKNTDYSNDGIRDYIVEYKGQYDRESIKTALVNAGNNTDEVEKYLVKFFDSDEKNQEEQN